MSTSSIPLRLPAPSLPWLRTLGAGLQRAAGVIWIAFEGRGHERSRRELLALADRYQHDQPKLARELRSYVRGGSSY
jgi:hypothetical protein